jgi:hypothetical protein
MTQASDRSKRWKQRHMKSFRASEHLHEMIKLECKRRKTNFSSFIRNAALGALQNRPYHVSDTVAEVTSAKSNLPDLK